MISIGASGFGNAPKKEVEKFEPQGKYEYDVFYQDRNEQCVGYTRGDNQAHAKENFLNEYGDLKINHFQRLYYTKN
jgi:hypothetical protein